MYSNGMFPVLSRSVENVKIRLPFKQGATKCKHDLLFEEDWEYNNAN